MTSPNEKVFSDEDKERLKTEYSDDHIFIVHEKDGTPRYIRLSAILARLEAADRLIAARELWDKTFDVQENTGYAQANELQSATQALRKAAGK